MTSAPDHADDEDTLPPPKAHGDKPLTAAAAAPGPDKPSIIKCTDDSLDDSEDRPTWRPSLAVPRSPTASSGVFEAVPSSKRRFSRRRVG